MKDRLIAHLLVALWVLGSSAATHAQSEQERQLIKRGEGRADLTMYHQENDPDGSYQWKWQLRVQRPWILPEGWKITWRADAPLLLTNKLGPANPDGDYDFGIGDAFAQLAITTPDIAPNLSLNVGFRLVTPLGGKGPFGTSQWKAAPQFGIGYDLRLTPAIVLEFDPLVRHFRGFGPTRPGITTSRTFDVYPSITLSLPDDWAVSLWNENPIIYNARTNTWFVPLDLMVVKRLNSRFQIGAGAAIRLIDDNPVYKYMMYFRTSVFF